MESVREFVLKTQGRDQAPRVFAVTEERRNDRPGWIYRIASWSRPGHFFEAQIGVVEQGLLQVDSISHYGIPEFKAKGIPEALYRWIVANKQADLRSSSEEFPDPRYPHTEWLSESAQKVWARLQRSGEAHFDDRSHRWVLSNRRLE